jgi:enamine deaminase RidA (YjgF/YER057c/UK114 family)
MSNESKHPEEVLKSMGIELPDAPAPAASYLPWVRTENLLLTAGQISVDRGEFVAQGIVGDSVTLEQAQACARQCAINILAQAKAATGDLSKVKKILKLTVFVASTADFTSQHLVANGASEFMAEVFGEAGRHARSAVGVPCLPLNSPVEIEAIIELSEA